MKVSTPDVLLVEDDADVRLLVRALLAQTGMRNPIVEMSTAAEARAHLERLAAGGGEAALVLCDLQLGAESGLELLEWLRAREDRLSATPFVLLTGSGNPNDLKDATRRGASAYLVKPVGSQNLLETIMKLRLPWVLAPATTPSEA